jgi:hypothetical protein
MNFLKAPWWPMNFPRAPWCPMNFLKGGSGHGVGSHGPRTVTLSVAPRGGGGGGRGDLLAC